MRTFRNRCLASAASLGALATAGFGAAQAADLPSGRSSPVSYVKVCDAYGAGFFTIPGTETCIKMTGNLQANYDYTPPRDLLLLSQTNRGGYSGKSVGAFGKNVAYVGDNSASGFESRRSQDTYGFQADLRFGVDARTSTPYGTVRTVISLRDKYSSGILAGNGFGPTGAGGYENKPTLDRGYIQFAGFTAGRTSSPLAFYYEDDDLTAMLDEKATTTVFNYTFIFPMGVSLVAGFEDPRDHAAFSGSGYSKNACCSGLDYNYNYDGKNGGHYGVGATWGPMKFPDVVAALRVDQAWGSAQLSGVAHDNSQVVPDATGTQRVLDKRGYGVLGGVKINLPMLADGDQFWLQGAYANGALETLGVGGKQGNISSGDNARLMGGLNRQDVDTMVVANPDGSFTQENEKGFGVLAVLHHYWVPDKWRSNLFLNYTSITPGTQTRNTDWTLGGLSKAQEYKIGTNLIWTPARGLDIGAELMYTKVNQSLTSNPGQNPSKISDYFGSDNVKIKPNQYEAYFQVVRRF